MLLAPEGRARRVRKALDSEGMRQMPFSFDTEGAKVLLNV
jgi:hypothetical protein